MATSFPSHHENLLYQVTTTVKPENSPMMVSVFKEFPESHNQVNKNWEDPASEEVTKVVSVVFKDILSETALKYQLTKVRLSENCKFAQAKLVSHVVFASVSPSMRITDIKLQEIHRNILKMTGCFIKLLSQLSNILKTSKDHKDEKLEAIQTFKRWHQIDRACNPMQPNLLSKRKKFLLSGVSSEYKDLAKFAEDTDPHLIGEELEDSLKKSKRRRYSLQALNPKTNYPIL